ncbi:hypothetical protein FRC20_005365 [Serendipita sp. 405]|nr:hypothetical protein FRC15_005107 [Serendipita sp. 397]KAG8840904.1 hypothetical protein FRC20_005365 [Serendipita sp. 405]
MSPQGTPSTYTTSSYSTTTSYDWSQASTSSSVSSSSYASPSVIPSYPAPHYPPHSSTSNSGPQTSHNHLLRSWSDASSLLVPPNLVPPPVPPRTLHSASTPLDVSSTFPLYPPPSYSSLETSNISYSPPKVDPSSLSSAQRPPTPTVESSTDVQASPEALQTVNLPVADSPTKSVAPSFVLPVGSSIFTPVASESSTSIPGTPASPPISQPPISALPTKEELSSTVQSLGELTAPVPPREENNLAIASTMEESSIPVPSGETILVVSPTAAVSPSGTPIEANPDLSLGMETTPLVLPVTPLIVSPLKIAPSSCVSLIVEPQFNQPLSSASSSSPSTGDISLPTTIPLPDSPIDELGNQTLCAAPAVTDHQTVVEDAPIRTTTTFSQPQTPNSSTVILPIIELTPVLSIEDRLTGGLPAEEPSVASSSVAESKSTPTLTTLDTTTTSLVTVLETVPSPVLPPSNISLTIASPMVAPSTTTPPTMPPQIPSSLSSISPSTISPSMFPPPLIPPPYIPPSLTADTTLSTIAALPSISSSDTTGYIANSQTMSPSVVDSPVTILTESFEPPSVPPPAIAPYTAAASTAMIPTGESLMISSSGTASPPGALSVVSNMADSPLVAPPIIPPSINAQPATIISPSIAPLDGPPPSIPTPPPLTIAPSSTTAPSNSVPHSDSSAHLFGHQVEVTNPQAMESPTMNATTITQKFGPPSIAPPGSVALTTVPLVATHPAVEFPSFMSPVREEWPTFSPPLGAPPPNSSMQSNSLVSSRPVEVAPMGLSPPTLPSWMAPSSTPPPIIPPLSTADSIVPLPPSAPTTITILPLFVPPSTAPPVAAPLYNPPPPPTVTPITTALSTSIPHSDLPSYAFGYSGYSGYPAAPVSNGALSRDSF